METTALFRMTAPALSAGRTGSALAGEQYVGATGFAASGHGVVSYFDLPQSGIGAPQLPPLPGSAAITASYNGASFAIASTGNRDHFLADPAAFTPQYVGHCACGLAKAGKVPGNPTLWRSVDGNWPGSEATPASRDKIFNFVSDAPEPN